jgi:hypothetical protein
LGRLLFWKTITLPQKPFSLVLFLAKVLIMGIVFYLYSLVGWVMLLPALVPLGGGGVVLIIQWIIDWIRWQKWLKTKSQQAPITVDDLLQSLTRYDTATFSTRFIRVVREQGLLAVNENTEVTLRWLAIAVERPIGPEMDVSSAPRAFLRWCERFKDKKGEIRFPRQREPDFLDEINMLLEQVRANRRNR